jgi:hypothetical protein
MMNLTLIFCHILFCISTLVMRCLMSLPCVWMMSSMHEAADLVNVQGSRFRVQGSGFWLGAEMICVCRLWGLGFQFFWLARC